MKKIIFLLSIVYLPALIAMEKEKEYSSKITTMTICTDITNALNNDIKNAIARLKPINQFQETSPYIVDIFPLAYTELYVKKAYGQKSIINQILLPKDNPKGPIEYKSNAANIVISLAGLHCLKNKYKKQLFKDAAKSLTDNGQVLFCISAEPCEYHPAIQTFEKLKAMPDFNYLSKRELIDGYHYITPEKARRYLNKAKLNEIKITPYTRTIIFKNASIFKEWLLSWMPLLPAFKDLADDKKIVAIKAFADIYLQDNPASLDGTTIYSYPHLLIQGENQVSVCS